MEQTKVGSLIFDKLSDDWLSTYLTNSGSWYDRNIRYILEQFYTIDPWADETYWIVYLTLAINTATIQILTEIERYFELKPNTFIRLTDIFPVSNIRDNAKTILSHYRTEWDLERKRKQTEAKNNND